MTLLISLIRILLLSFSVLLISFNSYAEERRRAPSMTPEEFEQFNANAKDMPFVVGELSAAQRYTLEMHRKNTKALFARHLGILSLQGNKQDIPLLQRIIDSGIVKTSEIENWQALGVLFGDVLANEFNMAWVRYEDGLGLSKALRWRKTDNFMFPLTMFSKRVGFGEKINVEDIYNKIAEDVDSFKRWELKPKLPNVDKSS